MKIKFCLLFIMVVLFAGIRSTPAQVTNLGIAPAGNQMVLYWPTPLANYTLQSATNLASTNWVPATNAVQLIAITVTNSSPANFFRLYPNNSSASNGVALIPAGSFTMGDNLDGEYDAIPTNIYVSAYYMETNLVSYGQWVSVYNYATNHGYGFYYAGSGKAASHPVQTVDWFDVVKWCNARSQQAGLTPVYYTDAGLTQVYTNWEATNVFVNWATNGYRLPTEAEWEKAARGGLSGQRFPWGDTISETNANYYGRPNEYTGFDFGPYGFNAAFATGGYPFTSPVGAFATNGFGLYDMTGNVWEWCWDWYGTPYGQLTTNNPTGPAFGGTRIARGGSWVSPAYLVPVMARNDFQPETALDSIGFRCVRKQ
jgi:formylglycine-generating enzyme required for sulfatase activity